MGISNTLQIRHQSTPTHSQQIFLLVDHAFTLWRWWTGMCMWRIIRCRSLNAGKDTTVYTISGRKGAQMIWLGCRCRHFPDVGNPETLRLGTYMVPVRICTTWSIPVPVRACGSLPAVLSSQHLDKLSNLLKNSVQQVHCCDSQGSDAGCREIGP